MNMDTFLRRNNELLEIVDCYVRSADSKNNKNRLLLCMSQIQKILKLLIEVTQIKEPNLFGIKEITNYLGKRLEWCVEECERVLGKNKETVSNDDCYGRFVKRVDRALLLISEGLNCSTQSDITKWKPVVDDIICQSLTIAAMAAPIDSEEITASCQKVLGECKRLEEECKESVTSLQSNFLADWILQLERRVSAALLRLVVNTFSDYSEPLKRLILAIDEEKCNVLSRKPSDLDEIVDNFDRHSDCIQHIALFALACSEYSKNVLKVRCCLASVESLEDSLVPAAMALYMDPKHPGKRLLLKFLVSVWLDEVRSLEECLDCIIDPVAFTAVTLESIETLSEEVVTESNRNAQPLIAIVLRTNRLYRHLNTNSIEKERKLSAILTECKIALDAWLKNGVDRHGQPVTLKRVKSRFNLLLHTVKTISAELSADLARNNDSYQNTSALLKDMSFPDSIRDLPLDISSSVSLRSRKIGEADMLQKLCFANFNKLRSVKKSEKPDVVLLDAYKLKAAEKCLLANTLYAPSPRRVKHTPITALRKPSNQQFQLTMGLDLTGILEQFADISQATLSTIDHCTRSESSMKNFVIEIEDENSVSRVPASRCELELENDESFFPDLSGIRQLENSLSKLTMDSMFGGRSDGSSVITLDRLNDLKKVEERIEYLKQIANS
ncbi:uncharacterized protein LOC111057757 isoform X2 [Nilaparvata lugens]|uniref:uncharacterized protein LOC111057757 isoform X2 n=1 Tax=Nilaparvata lugens TaxID=108931 RepID=UPI00193CDA67|nr:uncharacterized protein LOC111057757 isoform X2 [Nilaparvata lugens]XP_039281741.1 uncharacterized protein LOC111057757 isoform X2 [Nilaparvata lugens]XP_039281742.1 uncharacterized protein LOC111057757 isoform X2 [Nilaparvata lugens]XP_039281743.1 uncharacterized protein LOC111057757 isoform X2 [Nilaparvata lugens]